jgi:RimJ/RimL family protein N-acetyltransferase
VIVRDAPPEHLGWIAERACVSIHPAFRAIEAVDAAGKIHGMVGFDGWFGNTVSLHIALENPAALRSLLRDAFRIAFDVAQRGVALCCVVATNRKSLRLVQHLGFRFAYSIRDGWAPGVDMVWFEMRRAECRYLRPMRKAA